VPKLLRDVTKLLIFGLAISGVLSVVFRQPIGAIWAASGAVGIVVGLALRNVIVDVFMGLALNFDRPFEIGDFVCIIDKSETMEGRVVELGWRTTRLINGSEKLLIIPNGRLGNLTITNFSRPTPVGEMEYVVAMDVAVPPDRALRLLTAGVMSVAGRSSVLATPRPRVRVTGLNDGRVQYKIKYFLDPRLGGPGKARSAVLQGVLKQLHFAGLERTLAPLLFQDRTYPTNESRDELAALVGRTDLFRDFDADARLHLADGMRPHRLPAGAVVIRAGDTQTSMFVVAEGFLRVTIPGPEGDGELEVGSLDGGSFFGEMSALTGAPRTATVTAVTDVLLLELQAELFASLIDTRPEVVELLGVAIAERQSTNSARLAQAGTAVVEVTSRGLVQDVIDRIVRFFRAKPVSRV
jgi:CRP-like cAMP-binding protein